MPKSLAFLTLAAALSTVGCTQLTIRGGSVDFDADEEAVDDGGTVGAGVALESNFSRYLTFETAFWYDGELSDDVGGADADITMASAEFAMNWNLVPDQRDADRFFLDVGPAQHDPDEEVPWLLAPLRWWEQALPWLVPYISVGAVAMFQSVDIDGVESEDAEDVQFKIGGGFKINCDDYNQLSFGIDTFESASSDDEFVEGSFTRIFLGYSMGF